MSIILPQKRISCWDTCQFDAGKSQCDSKQYRLWQWWIWVHIQNIYFSFRLGNWHLSSHCQTIYNALNNSLFQRKLQTHSLYQHYNATKNVQECKCFYLCAAQLEVYMKWHEQIYRASNAICLSISCANILN